MRLNKQIFHNFFYYADRTERGKSATHYTRGHFFSYATEIGMIYSGEGRPVCFMADSSFSNTTAGHISALADACPLDIIRVPFEYGDDFSMYPERAPETLKNRFIAQLKSYAPEHFTRKPARDGFNNALHNFRAFLDCTGQTIPAREARALAVLEAAAEESPEAKARRAEVARKRAEKTRRENARKAAELEKTLKALSISTLTEKAQFAFTPGRATDYDTRARVMAALRAEYPGYAFLWVDGDNIKTSKGVTVDLETVRRAYSLFTAGKLTAGMHLGPYTVREIAADFVQIGCHKIAMENIREIAAAL